jgi:hypothetical protein
MGLNRGNAGGQGNKTNRQIKVIIPQITPSIRRLHNQLLPVNRPARERQLVASTAPRRLVAARNVDGRPAVGHGVVDGPGRLGGTHEGAAAVVAPALGVAAVTEGAVVLVARRDGVGRVTLLGPAARRLAAVPVPRRLAGPGRALSGDGEEEGEEAEEGRAGELHIFGLMDAGQGFGGSGWDRR